MGRLNTGIGYFVAILLGLFAVAIPLDLLIRRIGLGNMPWLYELVEYILYIGVFLGTPWVLREGAHVRVDLLISSLPRHVAVRLERVLDLAGAVVATILLYYGCVATMEAYVGDSRQFKTLIIFDWWLMAVFSVSMLLLGVEFLLRLGRAHEVLDAEEDVASKAGF